MTVLRFVLMFAALFLSPSSFADDVPDHSYWLWSSGSHVNPTPYETAQAAADAMCAASRSTWPQGPYSDCSISGLWSTVEGQYKRYGMCVTTYVGKPHSQHECFGSSPNWTASALYNYNYDIPPPVNCEADKVITGVGYPSSSNSASSVNFDGCQAVPVGVTMCRVDTTEPGGWRCVGDLRLTGDTPPPETPEVLPSPDIASDPQNDVSGSETSDATVEPTVTQPDGTLIDVATVTNLAIAAAGVSISENPSTITVVESDGVTTETETTVTVTTNPDGSYSERTDTVVTTTNPGGARTLITKSDGSVTIENIPSGSRIDTSSQTTYFDANGRQIGSVASSGSSGEGSITVPGMGSGGGQGGEGDGLGSFCNWADIVCQFAEWFLEEPLFPDNPEVPFTEITMDDVDDFDSGVGAGQCPADVVISTMFGSVPISWEYPCQLALTFRPVVLFFAWIAALYIVVRVK